MSSSLKNKIEEYFDRLWPLNRSITGVDYRKSLDILSEIMPTNRLKFKTNQKVFDWKVPEEWNVKDAYFVDSNGKKHADFKKNNLHLVGYSIPFQGKLSKKELEKHLHFLPEKPDAIPYVVSYYKKTWGFCISYREYQSLPEGDYEIFIDSMHFPGHIEIGEVVLEGKTDEEILFSTYLCHSSMANNELSGPLVMAFLFDKLKDISDRRYTYRFAIMPETIGSICYLTERGMHLKKKMVAGFQLTCLGDPGNFSYKLSRRQNTLADKVATLILRDMNSTNIYQFDPSDGTDDRQYCSPGFNLPFGSLMRTPYSKYYEYHTSLDNKDFISFKALEESVNIYFKLFKLLEYNIIWESKNPYCEPQLGKRNLYPNLSSYSGHSKLVGDFEAIMWLLNMADGTNDIIQIANVSKVSVENLLVCAKVLYEAGLIDTKNNIASGLMKNFHEGEY